MPAKLQVFFLINPMAQVIEQTRKVAVLGVHPDALYIMIGTTIGIVACELSYRVFTKAKGGFADVL
jgi:lipopolysaccharide transport system permease protein